ALGRGRNRAPCTRHAFVGRTAAGAIWPTLPAPTEWWRTTAGRHCLCPAARAETGDRRRAGLDAGRVDPRRHHGFAARSVEASQLLLSLRIARSVHPDSFM